MKIAAIPLLMFSLFVSLCSSFAAEKKVLIFTKSAGFQHAMTKREGEALSPAEQILGDLARQNGLTPVFSKDGGDLRANYLAQFSAVVFYTTGDLGTVSQNGRESAVGAEGKVQLLDAIRSGRLGFIGLHCASDTWHSTIPGVESQLQRYQFAGEHLDPFLAMLGAEFIAHDAHGPGDFTITDPSFPHLTYQDETVTMPKNEWYSLKDFSPDLHVLMVLQTADMPGPHTQRGPYPLTWIRKYGEGRVFYTALGHGLEDWDKPSFRDLLTGALLWTSGQVEADTTPNISTVAPRAGEIPLPPPLKK